MYNVYKSIYWYVTYNDLATFQSRDSIPLICSGQFQTSVCHIQEHWFIYYVLWKRKLFLKAVSYYHLKYSLPSWMKLRLTSGRYWKYDGTFYSRPQVHSSFYFQVKMKTIRRLGFFVNHVIVKSEFEVFDGSWCVPWALLPRWCGAPVQEGACFRRSAFVGSTRTPGSHTPARSYSPGRWPSPACCGTTSSPCDAVRFPWSAAWCSHTASHLAPASRPEFHIESATRGTSGICHKRVIICCYGTLDLMGYLWMLQPLPW